MFFFSLIHCLRNNTSVVSKIDKYIIEAVKKKRIELDITQYELAHKIEVPRSFISMVESGKYGKKYSTTLLNEIAVVLECSPKDFMPDKPYND